MNEMCPMQQIKKVKFIKVAQSKHTHRNRKWIACGLVTAEK